MALLYERPLSLGKEALKLEKAAFKVYRCLLGDKHHLTVTTRPVFFAKKNAKNSLGPYSAPLLIFFCVGPLRRLFLLLLCPRLHPFCVLLLLRLRLCRVLLL